MQRREFIRLIGSSAVAWPLAAQAQQPGLPAVGFLSSRSPDEAAVHTAAFLRGMNDRGYIEDQSVAVQYRWAQGRYERLPAMASELVGLGVNIMVAVGGTAPALAAKAAAKVPIVFLIGEDPVKVGLVSSFNRPSGNVTGFSFSLLNLEQNDWVCWLSWSPTQVPSPSC